MKTLIDNVRIALRTLVKSPLYVATVVLTLALGIGANTAIFSVVNGVLLRPLPFEEPERLVGLWETKEENRRVPISAANFRDWQERTQALENATIVQNTRLNLIGGDEPERVEGVMVSPNVFETLGTSPAIGRGFLPTEDQPGAHTVAVLSHAFWLRRFGADESLVGRTIKLDTTSYTVVGILSPDFSWPLSGGAEILVPRVFSPPELTEDARRMRRFQAIGRLRPDVTLKQAQAEVDGVARQLETEYPIANTGWGVNVVPLHEQIVGQVRSTLWLLFGAVGLVLAVACANVIHLMLARSTTRRRESALRLALGAGRWQLSSLWLSESLLLAVIGGAFGLLLAFAGTRALIALNPGDLPRLNEITFDVPVLLFTLLVALVAGCIFGLVPVLSSARIDPQKVLQESSVKSTSSLRQRRLHGLLVVFESALAVVLLIGAGLLIHSFYGLRQIDPGFETKNRQAFNIFLPPSKYREGPRMGAFFEQALERIGQIPGVRSLGAVATLPLTPAKLRAYCFIEGKTLPEPGQEPTAGFDAVSPGYFKTMGIPLLQGSLFSDRNDEESLPVLVVNETLVRQFFPDQDPIGQRVSYESPEGPWKTIVGVVGDVRHLGLGAEPRAEMYHPYLQDPFNFMNLVVQSETGAHQGLTASIRRAIWDIDEDQPITSLGPLDKVVLASISEQRFTMYLFGLFAIVALILGAIGIYGVVTYLVSQGTQELGIRLALGAQRSDVLRLVIAKGLVPVLLGVGVGVAAAFALTRLMAGMLHQVSPMDPTTFVVIPLLLVAVGLAASWVPARRALKVDPVVSLRYE